MRLLLVCSCVLLLRAHGSHAQPTPSEKLSAVSRFQTGLQDEYNAAFYFGFLQMEGFSEASISFKESDQRYTERFFFGEEGLLDSIRIGLRSNDTVLYTLSYRYLNEERSKDTLLILKEHVAEQYNLHRRDTLYLHRLKIPLLDWEEQWTIGNSKLFYGSRMDSLTGELVRYSGRKVSAFEVLSFRDSTYINERYRQTVGVDDHINYYTYDADTALLHSESRRRGYNGYFPGFTEYYYRNGRRTSRVLAVYHPGGEPPHHRDPGKTNFHRKEGQLLQKYEGTKDVDGEISGLSKIKRNRHGYVKKVTYMTIRNGRFERSRKWRFHYRKSK